MSIKLQKDTEKYLLGSIKRFVAENMDAEIDQANGGSNAARKSVGNPFLAPLPT